jgi:hypothetical protein
MGREPDAAEIRGPALEAQVGLALVLPPVPVRVVARDGPTWPVVFEQTARWVEAGAFL